MTKNGETDLCLTGLSRLPSAGFTKIVRKTTLFEGWDAERAQGSRAQLGVCCCSMYWRMTEMGRPAQLPAPGWGGCQRVALN